MLSRRTLLKSAALTPLARYALASPPTPAAQTTHGPITGYLSRNILAFKAIPYGLDTAQTRFLPPRPPAPWSTPKSCTTWSNRAPQQSPERTRPNPEPAPVHYHLPPDEGTPSEDCLYLNLWTPTLSPRAKLPVLVYFHGGAYNNGTVNAALYDGTRLAEQNAVVVTVNHRLNLFGYLYLGGFPNLPAAYKSSGNAGQLDLILALHWVRDNIRTFGGDPNCVTIFGQSGGGAKCATLMAMPAARGLFHRVWTMSGQQVWAAPTALAATRAATALAAAGLTDPTQITPAALNALTLDQLQQAARTTPNWLPVLDGLALPRDPFSPDAPPQSAHIPMILGNTKDEIMGITSWQRKSLTWEALPALFAPAIADFRGPFTPAEIIANYRTWYPAYTPDDVFTAALAAFRSWPGQLLEAEHRVQPRAASPISAPHTWVYQLNFPSPTADGRAPHTLDLAFIFDNLALAPGMVGPSPADLAQAQPLATLMSRTLLHFARTGTPLPTPHWPPYNLRTRPTLFFDQTSTLALDPRARERIMASQTHYRQPGT